MSYIVTEACVDCVYTSCVDVCPVEAFHEAPNPMEGGEGTVLLINPDSCVDCDACVPECPVEAIFEEDNVPEDQQKWIELNANAEYENHPVVPSSKDPLKGPKCANPDAD
jgi:ferredoxin